jgi:hypothetical protein
MIKLAAGQLKDRTSIEKPPRVVDAIPPPANVLRKPRWRPPYLVRDPLEA